jgi:osmoprotectant transport system ATP-binding protein
LYSELLASNFGLWDKMSESIKAPLVEFKDVSFSHAAVSAPIISHLSFSVQQGETLVLLGESGCGKTTTLKLINRLFLPTAGEVMVEGKATTAWDPIRLRRRTGYVIQEGGLFPHFTVARNIGLVPWLERWTAVKVEKRVDELLAIVGLEPGEFRDRYPRELSGGQRQRVGVARALAAEPPLLLLDEPFGALDPLTRASLQSQFVDLTRRLNKTAVFVTHDVREALLVGSHIGLMDQGKLLLLETPENFLRSKNEKALAYIETLGLASGNSESEGSQ